MANSRKDSKYYIINDDVLKSGLKGNELLVYALVRSYVMAGIPFDLTVAKIMERTNIDRRPTVIEILQRLVAKGKLVKVGQEKVGVTSCVYELGGTEKVPERGTESVPVRKKNGYGKRTCRGTEKVPERYGKSTCGGTKSVPPYNNEYNTDNNTFNITDNNNNSLSTRADEKFKEKKIGEMVFQSGSVQDEERRKEEIRIGIMEGWRRHWLEQFGEEYQLRGSITQEVSDLTPAIMNMMEKKGKELTQEGVEEYCHDMFRDLFMTADDWQRSKWSLRLITRQLNELIKQNKQQRNYGTEQQQGPRKIADASQFVDRL